MTRAELAAEKLLALILLVKDVPALVRRIEELEDIRKGIYETRLDDGG